MSSALIPYGRRQVLPGRCRTPDRRQGGRPPAGYATALTAALTSAEVQGGKRRLSYSVTPTAPVVWSRITLSTIAADGDDLDRRSLPREAARCFPAGNGSRRCNLGIKPILWVWRGTFGDREGWSITSKFGASQSAPHRRHGGDRPDRVSAHPADLGDGRIAVCRIDGARPRIESLAQGNRRHLVGFAEYRGRAPSRI